MKDIKEKQRIEGKKVTVFGAARSGMAVALLLKKMGADVFVTEVKKDMELKKEKEKLINYKIDWETGGHTQKAIEKRDFIVLSPGVPTDLPLLKRARDKKIPVFSEIEVAYWLSKGKIVGITGSNGKTTTATLLGEILKEDGKKFSVCGNIGLPFSDAVEVLSQDHIVVLELSSFQLETISEFHPEIAAVINITSDHLDRHVDFRSYKEAKLRIFENQTQKDFAVLNLDDNETKSLNQPVGSKSFFFSTQERVEQGIFVKENKLISRLFDKEERVIDTAKIRIKGPHNLSNSACATCIAKILGVKNEAISRALENFSGVEHRLEEVASISGVKFINDSKATNVNSVWYALKSINGPIILLMGGRDKGGDFTKLKELIQKKVKLLILLGEAREKIKSQLGDLVSWLFVEDLGQAVDQAYSQAKSEDFVLLSPGCSSFDMFENYEHRGEIFKAKVLEKKDEI